MEEEEKEEDEWRTRPLADGGRKERNFSVGNEETGLLERRMENIRRPKDRKIAPNSGNRKTAPNSGNRKTAPNSKIKDMMMICLKWRLQKGWLGRDRKPEIAMLEPRARTETQDKMNLTKSIPSPLLPLLPELRSDSDSCGFKTASRGSALSPFYTQTNKWWTSPG